MTKSPKKTSKAEAKGTSQATPRKTSQAATKKASQAAAKRAPQTNAGARGNKSSKVSARAGRLKPSRAFIIGDRDLGLTIVITDPVMVVHYSAEDLQSAQHNDMSGQEPIVSMAAVVKDLVPHMRGVEVVQLRQRLNEIQTDNHGDFSLAQEEAAFAEADYARTMGRIIRSGGNVCDVDFCIALDIDPAEIVARGRNTEPASKIADYLKANATKPEKFHIGNLGPGELDPLDPWQP